MARVFWEPKISNGYGYTVAPSQNVHNVINVGVTDVVNANITPSSSPFYVRNRSLLHRARRSATTHRIPEAFKITRRYKGYGGSGVPTNVDPNLNRYYNKLANEYNGEFCSDLEDHNRQNLKAKGCPANGVAVPIPSGSCGTLNTTTINGTTYCVCPKSIKPLTLAVSVAELNPGDLQNTTKYYYDSKTGDVVLRRAAGQCRTL